MVDDSGYQDSSSGSSDDANDNDNDNDDHKIVYIVHNSNMNVANYT